MRVEEEIRKKLEKRKKAHVFPDGKIRAFNFGYRAALKWVLE